MPTIAQFPPAAAALLVAAALAPAASASADETLATGLPPTVKVSMSARGSAVAWSAPAPSGGYKLVIRSKGVTRDAAVKPSSRPFDVDLGDDGHGRLVATYSRCNGRLEAVPPRGCDPYIYSVTTARERRLPGLGRGAASDFLPTASYGRIAFARSVRGGQPRLYVRALDGGRLRALPFGRTEKRSGPTSLDLGPRGLAIAWKRTEDYGSQQVRYDPLRGGTKVLATYSGGALAGTDVVGVSATLSGVFWGTAGYGEGIGISRLFQVPRFGESSESRDPGLQLTSASGVSLGDAVVLSCAMGDLGPTDCRVVLLSSVPAVAAHAGPTATPATVSLTAIGTRIGDHPAYVRVVVDFTDGVINAPAVQATDPSPYRDGRVRIVVPGRNAQAQAPTVRREGVTARVLPGRNRVVVALSATARRLKYAGYQVLHDPERLVIDLYKSRPSAAGAVARYGRLGCLSLTTITAAPRRIAVRGTEDNVFEHSFPASVRSAGGRVLGRRTVTAAGGRWRARIPYRVAHAQTGIVEAVELSAKDGALSCLAQAPVALRP